jgi:hypothetical protein
VRTSELTRANEGLQIELRERIEELDAKGRRRSTAAFQW